MKIFNNVFKYTLVRLLKLLLLVLFVYSDLFLLPPPPGPPGPPGVPPPPKGKEGGVVANIPPPPGTATTSSPSKTILPPPPPVAPPGGAATEGPPAPTAAPMPPPPVAGPTSPPKPSKSPPTVKASPPASVQPKPSGPPPSSMAGPETISMPDFGHFQGNWLKKKEWLRHALEARSEIEEIVADIQNIRQDFISKLNLIDNELDDFYRRVGLDSGNLNYLFESIERYLTKYKERKIAELRAEGKGGVTTDIELKIEIAEEEVKKYKSSLEQLKLDLASLQELDASLGERIKVVEQREAEVVGARERAENIVNDMWYMIDDKKVRDLYYELSGTILPKVKTLKDYLAKTLMSNFDEVVSSLREQMKLVESGIDNLEKEGVIIKNRVHRIEKIKLEEEQKRLEKEAKEKEKEGDKEQSIATPVQRKGFWGRLYDWCISIGAALYSLWLGEEGTEGLKVRKKSVSS